MVLCHLAGLHADISRPALQALLVLLCNRFPKVFPLPNRLFLPSHRPDVATLLQSVATLADTKDGLCR